MRLELISISSSSTRDNVSFAACKCDPESPPAACSATVLTPPETVVDETPVFVETILDEVEEEEEEDIESGTSWIFGSPC